MAEGDVTSRFWPAKSIADEITSVEKAVPKAYKNQWALSVFREWQQKRDKKWPSFEFGGLFKANEIGSETQIVSTTIEDMATLSLNYLLSKFAFKICQQVRWPLSFPYVVWTCMRFKTLSW